MGMFEEAMIPNDLKAVDDVIREYYGMEVKASEADTVEKGQKA
jgi:hypothetical protein